MLDEKRANQLLDDLLGSAATAAPGAEVKVSLDSGRSANTRFARNEITSAGDVEETEVTVEVAFGKRHAATSTNQTDPGALRGAMEQAARLARLAPEDPEWMPLLGPQKYLPAASAWDDAAAGLGAETRADAARAAIARAEQDNLVAAGFFEHGQSARALGTSAGLRAYHASTRVDFTTTARTADATGSGWAGSGSHRAGEVSSAKLVEVACAKALRSASPRKLEPGRYTVVLEPAAVGSLLGFLRSALNARSTDEGRSFFSKPGGGNKLGESFVDSRVTLRSDAADPRSPGAPFDGDGLPLRATTWIEKGKLRSLVYSRYWAARQGKQPTGWPSTWLLEGGDATQEELIRGVKRGVLITRFWYLRWVDPQSVLVTGLTRDGVFEIVDGAIAGPVNNFRFNESPVVMLRNLEAMSRETVRLPDSNLRVPALRTSGFNLASISEAV